MLICNSNLLRQGQNSRFAARWLVLAAWLIVLGPRIAAAGVVHVRHAMGSTLVPDRPQRVVALTNESTEALLALGITPVGAVRSWHGNPWYDHLEARLINVTVVGSEFDLDLDRISELNPDLIIGNKLRHEQQFEALSAIGPTVLSGELYGRWKENLRLYSQAVGRQERANKALANFDERAARLAERLGSRLKDRISLVRFMPDETWAYCRDSFPGAILKQVGFRRPAWQDVDTFNIVVSRDRIGDLDGDRLIYFIYETGDGRATGRSNTWRSDPSWIRLSAVANGTVSAVSDSIWTTAGGIIAANLLLDDIAKLYRVNLQ